MIKNLHILVGLPGSGKTYWAQNKTKQTPYDRYYRGYIIDHEFFIKYHGSESISKIIETLKLHNTNFDDVIFDSFITKNEDVSDIIRKIISVQHVNNIIIHYWNPDIETCLWNDIGRRDISSAATIQNAQLEQINIEQIKLDTHFNNIQLENHTVVRKADWQIFCEKVVQKITTVSDDFYIESDTWSAGGDWKDCWGRGGTIEREDAPDRLKPLDDILEQLCPNVTFLKYRKIWDLISEETSSEMDWYGGCQYFEFYKLYIPSLYDTLIELELITLEQIINL